MCFCEGSSALIYLSFYLTKQYKKLHDTNNHVNLALTIRRCPKLVSLYFTAYLKEVKETQLTEGSFCCTQPDWKKFFNVQYESTLRCTESCVELLLLSLITRCAKVLKMIKIKTFSVFKYVCCEKSDLCPLGLIIKGLILFHFESLAEALDVPHQKSLLCVEAHVTCKILIGTVHHKSICKSFKEFSLQTLQAVVLIGQKKLRHHSIQMMCTTNWDISMCKAAFWQHFLLMHVT